LSIYFFCEDVDFVLKNKSKYKNWIKDIVKTEKGVIGNLNFIFTNEEKILKINIDFLNHDYFTDIITFNYNDNNRLSGDLYLCIETINSNSIKYCTTFNEELSRVMVHGILHLIGYNDDNIVNQSVIRKMEDFYLEKLYSFYL